MTVVIERVPESGADAVTVVSRLLAGAPALTVTSPYQHPVALAHRLAARSGVIARLDGASGQIVSGWSPRDDQAHEAIADEPLLLTPGVNANDLAELFDAVRAATGARTLYLPQVAVDGSCWRLLRDLTASVVWPRTPKPYIDWSPSQRDLWERVRQRDRFSPDRKRRLFDRDAKVTLLGPSAAFAAMAEIERASWKAQSATDLTSYPGHARMYEALVDCGFARPVFAVSGVTA